MQVLPALETGGVERGAVEMVQAIVRAGGSALVASAGGRMVAAVERAGGTHITLKLSSKNPARIWRNAARLAFLIRAADVDIVHARSRAPAWSAWLACRRTGARFVTTWHGVYKENAPGKRRYNAIMARGERIIAISQFVAAKLTRRATRSTRIGCASSRAGSTPRCSTRPPWAATAWPAWPASGGCPMARPP